MKQTVFRSADADDVWQTPLDVFRYAERRWGPFQLDAAASADNALCEKFIDEKQDALKTAWDADQVWVNPPYGSQLKPFLQRAVDQISKGNCKRVVMLIPARTDAIYFHDLVFGKVSQIHFIKTRIKFTNAKKGCPDSGANFASCFVVYDDTLPKKVTTGSWTEDPSTHVSFDAFFGSS